MSNRALRANVAITYPADAESLAIVRASGGASKVAPDDRARVRWKTVEAGERCDDLPEEAIELRLERGDVTVIDAETATPARRRAKRSEA